MGLQVYLFATYIFVLLCLLVLLCNYLFADLKRQRKLLDEKENKLLKLYSGLESTMDEFSDTVTAARTEWDQRDARLQQLAREIAAAASAPRPVPVSPRLEAEPELPRKRAPKPAPKPEEPLVPKEEEASFQLLFEQATMDEPSEPPAVPQPELRRSRGPTRHDNILALYEEGRSRTQIAQELGIAQNEVDLVIGIEKK